MQQQQQQVRCTYTRGWDGLADLFYPALPAVGLAHLDFFHLQPPPIRHLCRVAVVDRQVMLAGLQLRLEGRMLPEQVVRPLYRRLVLLPVCRCALEVSK